MQEVRFDRGLSTSMPSSIVPGTILVQTDTGDVFLDDAPLTRIQLGDSRKLSLIGGTMQGDIDMGGQYTLKNVGEPKDDGDIVSKKFVTDSLDTLGSDIDIRLEGYLPLLGGTMQGDIDLDSHFLKNLGTPADDSDAATKKYVDDLDTKISESISNIEENLDNYLQKSGGSMSGNIDMNGNSLSNLADPSKDTDAVTKKYVDDAVAVAGEDKYLSNTGGTITGDIDMSEHSVKNLADPVENGDAVNKKYFDEQLSKIGGSLTEFLKLDGSTPMAGNLNMGTLYKITNIADGEDDNDAVTMHQLHEAISTGDQGFFKADGSVEATGDFDLGSNRVTNLADPQESTDAVSKGYADSHYLGVDTADFGGNPLKNVGDAVEDNDAATLGNVKQEIENASEGFIKTDGTNHMNADLLLGSGIDDTHCIKNLADGVDDTDAVTVKQLNEAIAGGGGGGGSVYVTQSDLDEAIAGVTYVAGTGIRLEDQQIIHEDYGEATTYGSADPYEPSPGDVIQIPFIETNAQGHVISGGLQEVTLPTGGGEGGGNINIYPTEDSQLVSVLIGGTNDEEAEEVSQLYKSAKMYYDPYTGTLTVTKIDTIIDDGLIE